MVRARILPLALACLALACGAPAASGAVAVGVPSGVERHAVDHVAGELLVRIRARSVPEPGADVRAARLPVPARGIRRLPGSGLRIVKLRRGASVRSAA